MAITMCLIVGTIFIGLFIFNEFFYKKPVIPHSVKATVTDCQLSQSRVAKRMREDGHGFNLYDVTYEFTDSSGNKKSVTNTVRYKENIGEVKTMKYQRMKNGHHELQEIDLDKPQYTWFFLVIGCVFYLLILVFYLYEKEPEFINNIREYSTYLIASMLFIALSAHSFEKYETMKNLMNNRQHVDKVEAEIIGHKKKNPYAKESKISNIYQYEDDGKIKIYESNVYKRKQEPIGTKKTLFFDKYTGEFVSRRVAKSHQTTGIWSAMTGVFIIVLFIVKAIFGT